MDSNLITRTRIVVPRRRDELFTRQRLLDALLEILERRLVIISAPAGYGKTSLLVDFVHHLEWPACWYAIGDLDRDPLRFFAQFIAALQVRFPQFGRISLSALQNDTQEHLNIDLLVAALTNDIYENISEHFVFILDDYHLVDESRPINQFVSRFLQAVGENCHLLIASRTLLTLPDLPLLVSRAEVGGLSVEELSFQPAEIQALFLQNWRRVLPTGLANEMCRKTEGWIAGLILTSQLSSGSVAARRGALKGNGTDLYDYLAQQVLEKQPPEIQDFLLRTALLEEFNAPFCADVLEPALGIRLDWAGLMDAALRSNLFILPLDEESVWLRYHHLFLEFLQNRMAQERPQETSQIYTRLAQVYVGRGDWERAYHIFQRMGDQSSQEELLVKAGPELLISGRLNTLAEWLAAVPESIRSTRPELISLQGGVAIMHGKLGQGTALLDQAVIGLRLADKSDHLALTYLRRSVGRRLKGLYAESLADADDALALTAGSPGPLQVHAEALRARGMALLSQGQSHLAFDQLTQALEAFQKLKAPASAARLLLEVGMAHRSLGQLDEAELAYSRALELWEDSGNLAWQANLLNNLGVLQHERGEIQAAALSLERAVECARLAGYPRMEAFGLAGLGDLYCDLEAFTEADQAYHQAIRIAARVEENYLLVYLDLAQGVLARRQGFLAVAGQHFDAAARRAKAESSPVERTRCQLERAALALSLGKLEQVYTDLTDAADFFAAQGLRVEAARAELLLWLACAAQPNRPAALIHLQKLSDCWGDEQPWPPLLAAASEFLKLLEPRSKDPEMGMLAGRLVRQILQLQKRLPVLRRELRPQVVVVPLSPAKITIRTLGRIEVQVNHKLVSGPDWRSLAARELFFFLLSRPRGLSKEQIGVEFWPEATPDQLNQRFRNLIYRLRRAVGSEVVRLEPDETYRFNTTLDYEYDLSVFEREIEAAAAAAAPEDRLGHYLHAARLYQGSYLPEIDARWATQEREHWQQRYLETLLKTAELGLELGRTVQALSACQAALQTDGCLEEVHRLAMRSYAAEGDRRGVLHQYEICRQTLQEELGVAPSPQTRALLERLTQ